MRSPALALLLVAAAVVVAAAAAHGARAPRGVAPSDAALYTASGGVVCGSAPAGARRTAAGVAGTHVPLAKVNDNFCDCEDGIDEPGTNACENGRFWCANTGHVSTYIASQFVNDGVCDCCDGSDEWKTGVCRDTCAEQGSERMQELRRELDAALAGIEARRELLAAANLARLERETEVQTTRIDLEQARAEANIHKLSLATLSDAMSSKRAALEREQPDHAEVRARRAAAAEAAKQAAKAAEEASASASSSSSSSPPPPAGYVEGASFAEDEDARSPETSPPSDDDEVTDETDDEQHAGETATEHAGHAGHAAATQSGGGDDDDDGFSPSPLRDEYYGVRDEHRVTETTLRNAERRVSDLESALANKERILFNDYGPNHEWYALLDNEYSTNIGEYTYRIRPFEKVSQDHTSLGKFAEWTKKYEIMSFTQGEGCWNGPKRSISVHFECGSTSEILSVEEPSKCVYSARMRTPIACSEARVAELKRLLDNALATPASQDHGAHGAAGELEGEL